MGAHHTLKSQPKTQFGQPQGCLVGLERTMGQLHIE